jgi:UDP-arabinose 4-epimerase
MNILITGGAGYIGSHTCKALSKGGFTPVTYDNLSTGHKWAVKWGPLVIGDIDDHEPLGRAIDQYQPVAVMHFAGFIEAGESVENPGKYYANNVASTVNLLNAIRDKNIKNIIFSSSAAVYGDPENLPIKEDHALNPINPYGFSKRMIEQMLADYYTAHGICYIALRYFNAAGADPDIETGEAHNPESHLIPIVLDAAAGNRHHVNIYGNDYNTNDGTCIRDYIHVSDLADAHVLSLKALLAEGKCGIYNLGNGNGFSVREVITAATAVTRRTIPVNIAPRRPGDPPVLVANCDRIRSEFGWQPKHNDLDHIIETAWQWMQNSLTKQANRHD